MIYINIVGSINDKEQLSDFETIAKVFVVERRINDLTYNLNPKDIISIPPLNFKKKTDNNKDSYNKNLSLLLVRGFN